MAASQEVLAESSVSNTNDAFRITDAVKKDLIMALKDCPSLWNSSLTIYKDRQKKVDDSQALSQRFSLSVEEIKKVFHSLRTSMSRELKRMQKDNAYVSRWKFFKDMEFLKDEILKSFDKNEKEWEDEDVEILIEFFKENSFLWNHNLEKYRDRNLREVTLNKLAEMLSSRPVDDIKSQWHSLKTIFERENKRVEGSKRTGTGTDSVYKPSWKFYDCMHFIRECKDIDESVCTLTSSSIGQSEDGSKPFSKKRKKEIDQMADTRMAFLKQAINVLNTPEVDDEDARPGMKETSAFGQVVQETLARFTHMQRVVAKKKINDVLYEVEIGMNNSGGNTYGFSQPMVMPQYPSQGQFSLNQASYPHPQNSMNGPLSISPTSLYARSSSPASSISSVEGSQRGDLNSKCPSQMCSLSDFGMCEHE